MELEVHPDVLQVVLLPDDAALAHTLVSGTASTQVVRFREGHTYEGEWKQGLMHGSGTMEFPDGVKYEGQFEHSSISGCGVYSWAGGSYSGEVKQGRRHGQGRLTFAGSPVVYEGSWERGLRHGHGVLYLNADHTAYYKGQWKEDMKHGEGLMVYESGNTYSGGWYQDLKCGVGTMAWSTRQEVYSGEWQEDAPNGVGEHVWMALSKGPGGTNHGTILMFNRYQGMFKGGQRHGEGVLHYASGARYEGGWQHDRKQGEGVFLFEDGTTFQGMFEADKPVAGSSPTGTVSFGQRGAHVKVHIEDLLVDEPTPEKTLKGVGNVLMCFNSDLRALYDKYCKRVPSHNGLPPTRQSFCLLSSQFWELAAEAHLVCTALPLLEISHALMKARAPPALVQKRRTEVMTTHSASGVLQDLAPLHHPHSELLYRDFCEALVRIAFVRYPHHPSLEARLQHLITAHLLPLSSRRGPQQWLPQPKAVLAMRAAEDSDVKDVLQAAGGRLRRVFLEAAGVEAPELDALAVSMVYDWEVTARAVLRKLVQSGIVEDNMPGKLPLLAAVAALRDACQVGDGVVTQRVRLGTADVDRSDTVSVAASMAATDIELLSAAAAAEEAAEGAEGQPEEALGTSVSALDAELIYPQFILALILCAKAASSAECSHGATLKALLQVLC